jgi:hypothetical protein
MLRLAHSSICTVPDNADRIKESAECLDNIKCQQSETGSACLCSSPIGRNHAKNQGCESLTFFSLEMNKYIVQKCMYTVYKCIYIVYTVHTLQVHMSTNGVVIHYIG